MTKKKPRDRRNPSSIWPRATDSFPHSPNFYAENKDRFLRQLLIEDIEALTGRSLVVFFESPYFGDEIEADDVARLYELIHRHEGPLDLMLETRGGLTDATEALISLMLETTDDLRVIVPMRAKSNGTLLCLAARTIMMGPTSELGPIEPIIDGISASTLSAEEFRSKFFMLHEEARHALEQTKKVALRLLRRGMMEGRAEEEINQALQALCSRDHFPSHGSVIDAVEAEEIGLNVERCTAEDDTWRRFFQLHAIYAFDSQARGIRKFFEGRQVSLAVYRMNGKDE